MLAKDVLKIINYMYPQKQREKKKKKGDHNHFTSPAAARIPNGSANVRESISEINSNSFEYIYNHIFLKTLYLFFAHYGYGACVIEHYIIIKKKMHRLFVLLSRLQGLLLIVYCCFHKSSSSKLLPRLILVFFKQSPQVLTLQLFRTTVTGLCPFPSTGNKGMKSNLFSCLLLSSNNSSI